MQYLVKINIFIPGMFEGSDGSIVIFKKMLLEL